MTTTTVITTALTAGKEIFTNSRIGGIEGIVGALLVIITMLLITRDMGKWPKLAFIVTTAWHIAGVNQHWLLFIGTAISFTIDLFSFTMIGNTIAAITDDTRVALGKVPVFTKKIKPSKIVNINTGNTSIKVKK